MKYSNLFEALGSETRLELLDRLREKPGATLTELIEGIDGSRQGLSQHLTVLEQADLVVVRWDGREKLHYFNPIPLVEVESDWLPRFVTPEARALREVQKHIECEVPTKRRGRRRA